MTTMDKSVAPSAPLAEWIEVEAESPPEKKRSTRTMALATAGVVAGALMAAAHGAMVFMPNIHINVHISNK